MSTPYGNRAHPVAEKLARLCAILAASPLKTTAQIALRAEMGQSSVEKYLRQLERQGLVSVRLETVEEATTRVDRAPHSILTRRIVRRQMLWTRCEPTAERAA